MVWIWRPDFDYGLADGVIVANEQGVIFEDAYLGTPHGQPIRGEYSNLKMELVYDSPTIDLDFCMSGGMLMVSESLKSLLDAFHINAQYFRFELIRDGREVADRAFWYCRILDVIDCFDFSRGEYAFWEKEGFSDHVDSIKKLAIDESKVAGYQLFRIAKGGEYIICASDVLAKRIEGGGFRGIKFVPPEEWNRC